MRLSRSVLTFAWSAVLALTKRYRHICNPIILSQSSVISANALNQSITAIEKSKFKPRNF
jgi:hypothetical protein